MFFHDQSEMTCYDVTEFGFIKTPVFGSSVRIYIGQICFWNRFIFPRMIYEILRKWLFCRLVFLWGIPIMMGNHKLSRRRTMDEFRQFCRKIFQRKCRRARWKIIRRCIPYLQHFIFFQRVHHQHQTPVRKSKMQVWLLSFQKNWSLHERRRKLITGKFQR